MGTKTNPGPFDCYANAADDEPIFVLVASDETAPLLVQKWAKWRENRPGGAAKAEEARRVAASMIEWYQVNIAGNRPDSSPLPSI